MPPTIHYALLCVVSLALLILSGFGLSLHLVSRSTPHRVWTAFLISPAVALAEIGLILYPLFLNSIPVDRVEIPFTLILLLLSAGLLIVEVRAHPGDYKVLLSKANRWYLLGFVAIFLLLVLPAYLGGDHYRYWQGNSYDATNYWSLTYFVAHIPIRELNNPSALQTAAQLNPGLIMPLSSDPVRLVVELPLAWLSLLFNLPVYEFYYYFKLLALAVTFFVALAVARRLKLPAIYHFSMAAVLSIGFWAWYVSDVDALSHLYSIPLGLLFLLAWLQLEEDAPLSLFTRQRVLFSISLAALLGYYPEFIPLTIFAIVLYHTKLLFDFPARRNLERVPGNLVTMGMIVLLVLPTLGRMLHDLVGQSAFATTSRSISWAPAFYSWLYTRDMLAGRLWGLSYYSEQPINILATTALGVALGCITLVGILRNVFDRKATAGIGIVTALLVSFWGGGLMLYLLGRDWVAGKAFAMGAPFALVALFVFTHQILSTRTIRVEARYLAATSLVVWVVAQFLVPVIRATHFVADQGFQNYVDVKSPIGDIVPVINYLKQSPPELLVSYFPGTPRSVAVGWEMMLSDQFRHFALDGLTRYYDQTPIEFWQRIDEAPSHLLFASPENYLHALGIGALVPIENTPFQLYAVSPEDLDQSVFRSNLLEDDHENGFSTAFLPLKTDPPEPYRALESAEGHIRFLAGSSAPIGILMGYKTTAPGSLSFQFDGETIGDEVNIDPDSVQSWGLCTTMSPGANDLIIHYANANDTTISPLELNHFQVMPADGFRVDVGAINDGINTPDGWYYSETGSDFNFRWAAKTANVTLLTCKQSDYTLRFRAFPIAADQAVTVFVNGDEVGKVALEDGLQEYEIHVPAAALNATGLQTLTFEHAYAQVPENDTRQLAAFYDWIELRSKP